ncbi:alpha/beta fold hydrolase [Methylobacterium sp. Leaf118]|uniref:alpha/beta fold hydrolase n=1 Tax=Methylobacterium sp. Leaf118 TaxID=2876562 RepID=UPI001E4DE597|nr:alpha/beta hydrolase [Methylobacterium sp. Leaf118]
MRGPTRQGPTRQGTSSEDLRSEDLRSRDTARRAARPRGPWAGRTAGALALVPLAAAGAWIAWSHLGLSQRAPLPPALPGRRSTLRTRSGPVGLYAADARAGRPLLLIHSINAAANAYEVRPLYERFRGQRPVYALELPGFGSSERANRLYTPRLMTDAILDAAAEIAARHGGVPVDAIALSLSCAYLARAALDRPDLFATLGLISPTGFDARLSGRGPAETHRGSKLARGVAAFPLWGRPLFDALVSRPSIRFFLEKTWGSRAIDEGLLAYDGLSAHQPGAEHAPFSFLAGYLFPNDTTRVYEALALPVFMVHGARGDFVDYRYVGEVVGRPNWTCLRLLTGAFPHFERPAEVADAYEAFLEHAAPA